VPVGWIGHSKPVQFSAWMKVARRQGGVLTRAQCREHGLTDRQIDGLITNGCLNRAGYGVLRVAGTPVQPDTSMWTAVLATRGALVCASAAFLWQMLDEPPPMVQIAVARQRRVIAPRGTTVIRTDIPARELTRRFGLPVTGRTRTAVDYIAALPPSQATPFADRAMQQGWVTATALERRLERRAPGNSVVRRVLKTFVVGAEAESERRMHVLLKQAGVTGWVPNFVLHVGNRVVARIDIAFVAQRIAIEIDGFAYHSDRGRFQRDRLRQNALVLGGWSVLRFTWDDITARPEQVISTVRSALASAA
jgi:very-short-patch-repair endonuclease